MFYKRQITSKIISLLGFKPVIMLFGARQIGKTTTVKEILKEFKNPLYISCDNKLERDKFENRGTEEIMPLIAGYDIVVFDEAQVVQNIGTTLKLIADNIDKTKTQIIATGSSSFELGNKLNEPLTGRNTKLTMFPLSVAELVEAYGKLNVNSNLNNYLTYGTYPGILSQESVNLKIKALEDLTQDYLYKDLFNLGDIRNRFAFQKVVHHLALRIGSEISYEDIAKDVGVSAATVQHYVDLLEDAFIVFRIRPYFTNKIKEISKNHKVYFYDNGIRNAIIGNYEDIQNRPDKGQLFENFVISEKVKSIVYSESKTILNFWRKRAGDSEVDLLETTVHSGVQKSYEIKWNKTAKLPESFINIYGEKPFEVITTNNVVEFFTK